MPRVVISIFGSIGWVYHRIQLILITKLPFCSFIFPLQIAYMFFLIMFSFTVLVKMEQMPRWQEWYSIAYITTLGFEKVREIISSEPVAIT